MCQTSIAGSERVKGEEMNIIEAFKDACDIRRKSNKLCRINKVYSHGQQFVDFNQIEFEENGDHLVDVKDLLADDWESIDFYEKL